MRGKWLYGAAGLTALGLLTCALAMRSGAQGAAGPAGAPGAEATVAQLPIGQVVLFSSGVGYFQREGQVEGTSRVDLSFPVGDINDLIKSMVLRDMDGGHVAAVSYDSNAPIERTLRSFAVNLTGNPGFESLLNQVRGERVEVALVNAAGAGVAGNVTGNIVGVEKQRQAVGASRDVVEVALLNLWCSDGLRSVKLSEV